MRVISPVSVPVPLIVPPAKFTFRSKVSAVMFKVPPVVTLTFVVPEPKAVALPRVKVPAEIVVDPVKVLADAKVQVLVPVLARDRSPEVAGSVKTGFKVAAKVPVTVNVGELAGSATKLAVLLNVKVPVPDESIVPPFAPMVNNRSVETAAPVYFKVPPLITKLEAALLDLPRPLATPPFASVDTESVPALIVVTPA